MPTATITYNGHLRTTCTHCKSQAKIITDAPVDNQGKGEAFAPSDLLSVSLASCMLTIIGIAAAKANINFNSASAEMEKIMAENPRRVSEVIITIQMPKENYSPTEKTLLENAALNCTVAKSLSSEIKQTVRFEY